MALCGKVPLLSIELAWPHGLADALGKDYAFLPLHGVFPHGCSAEFHYYGLAPNGAALAVPYLVFMIK